MRFCHLKAENKAEKYQSSRIDQQYEKYTAYSDRTFLTHPENIMVFLPALGKRPRPARLKKTWQVEKTGLLLGNFLNAHISTRRVLINPAGERLRGQATDFVKVFKSQ